MKINITSIINKAWTTERREEAEQLTHYKFLSLYIKKIYRVLLPCSTHFSSCFSGKLELQ